MSLPNSYSNATEYLRDVLLFLKEYQWIFKYQNTHLLVNDIFSYFPCEWFNYCKNLPNEELNKLPMQELKDAPESLNALLRKINLLKPNVDYKASNEEATNFSHNCGLSNKKRHEIVCLAPIINKICREKNIDIVIDIGSGLGYLSHHLNTQYNYNVLGIECSKQYIDLALKNQEKYYFNSKNKVIFKQHYIDNTSVPIIKELVEDNFKSIDIKSGVIVGLHACADLSVTILNVFNNIDFVKSLVIMPCCYHRLQMKSVENEVEYFINFPISTIFKQLYEEFEGYNFLNRSFLRLSCQQTVGHFVNMSEEEHKVHSQNLMFRCILQAVAENEKCEVKRLKRKSNNTNSTNPDDDFESYLKNICNTHKIIPISKKEAINIDHGFLEKMRTKWMEYKDNCYMLEALSGLQAAFQSICENVLLLDRVEYVKEKGYKCAIQRVTNDVLSPRCHALIATK